MALERVDVEITRMPALWTTETCQYEFLQRLEVAGYTITSASLSSVVENGIMRRVSLSINGIRARRLGRVKILLQKYKWLVL